MTNFTGLGLIEPLTRAVAAEGYDTPTPIQAQSIPDLLTGRDLLGVAQTGTGKTAAFVLPILQRLHEANALPARKLPRVLILAPTRELALQIHESIVVYARHLSIRSVVVFGGVPMGKQVKGLNDGAQILVATPGRLMDLMNQDKVRLNRVETFVLDEADRMLDMGFVNDVRKISAEVPEKRQTVLFSATMPENVRKLASGLMDNPVRVEVTPQSTTAERIGQRVFFVPKDKKRDLLTNVLKDKDVKRVLVFTRTKHSADRVARHLEQRGISAGAIHGNKTQNARQRALDGFKTGQLRALVATDIAARGIDVDGVSHVINFDLPNDAENYVHRIGRTARGGEKGEAISFCDAEERGYLRDIEKAIRQEVTVFSDHPFHAAAIAEPEQAPPKRGGGGGGGGRGRGGQQASGRKPQGASAKGANGPSAKGKGHRPTDGKRHSDKGHGGHGHGAGGAGAKNHGAKGGSRASSRGPRAAA